jgi:hypothetical protein
LPTKRSRSVDDQHPVARYLFQAADLNAAQTLILDYASPAEARKAALRLRKFRDTAALSPPGTYEGTAVDPKGEGRGHFDHIEIRLKGTSVALGLREVAMPEPVETRVCGR